MRDFVWVVDDAWELPQETKNTLIVCRIIRTPLLPHPTLSTSGQVRYLTFAETDISRSRSADSRSNSLQIGGCYPFDFNHPRTRALISEKRPLRIESFGNNSQRDLDAENYLRTQIENHLTNRAFHEPLSITVNNNIANAKVYIWNVGQGDTIVIDFIDGELWVIDMYFWRDTRYGEFANWMKTLNRPPTRLIVSHLHHDHIRHAKRFIEDFNVPEVVVSDYSHPTDTARDLIVTCAKKNILKVLKSGTINPCPLQLGQNVSASFYTTPQNDSTDPNDHEIMLRLSCSSSEAIFAGDTPGEYLNALHKCQWAENTCGFDGLKNCPNVKLTNENALSSPSAYSRKPFVPARYYKVSHHCSNTGRSNGFLCQYNPTEAVTSCAVINKYKHPHEPMKSMIDKCTNGNHRITKDLNWDKGQRWYEWSL